MLNISQFMPQRIPKTMIRPIEVRAFDMADGETVAPHAHPWGQFTYSAKGVLTVLTPSGHFTAPPNMAIWLPPNVTHDVKPIGPAKFRSLYIAQSEITGMPENCAVLSVDALLKNLILEAAKLPREWQAFGQDNRLMSVLIDRIKCAPPAPLNLPLPTSQRLKATTNSLLANPADRRTIEQHAKNVGASSRNLSRLFKQETGMTFGAWRRRRILLSALEQLAQGKSVTAISLELGYESPSAFIAMFKQSLGVTPTQYIDT